MADQPASHLPRADTEGPSMELSDLSTATRWKRFKARYAASPPPVSVDDAPDIPLAHASYISRLTFYWMDSLLLRGFKRPLESSDLWQLDETRQAGPLADRLLANIDKRQAEARAYNASLSTVNPSVLRQIQWIVRGATQSGLPKNLGSFGPVDTLVHRVRSQHAEWQQHSGKRGGGITLARALIDTFPSLWTALPYKACADAAAMLNPLLTKAIIRFSQQEYAATHASPSSERRSKSPGMGRGIAMTLGLFLLFLFQALVQGQFQLVVSQEGLKAKAGLSQALYTAAVRHTVSARAQHLTGKLVTHLSADIGRVALAPRFVIGMIVTPVTLAAVLILLCIQIGVAGIIGFVAVVVAMPITNWLTRQTFKQRKQSTEFTTARSKLLQELLASMAAVKMFTYELPFLARLDTIRQSEMKGVRNINFLSATTLCVFESLPLVGSVFAFIMYSALHPHMDVANLFTALTYFNLLQGPLYSIPAALASPADATNALQRLSPVFEAEQRRDESPSIDPQLDVGIRVRHASFQWEHAGASKVEKSGDPLSEPFAVRDLSLEVPRGRLAAIIGPVGSGKSSILQGVLGDMRSMDDKGAVLFGGRTAYCPQVPWIQNATLRDNVVFGQPWNEDRYWRCIAQASLTADLDILPDRDHTEIGEKGINLSGGQKQRISIARALYYDAEVFLLDDPLSALDAHVGKAVFNNAILELCARGKSVLLVTHGLHLLPHVDYIYSVSDGRIVEQGTYSDLKASPSFTTLIDTFGGREEVAGDPKANNDPKAHDQAAGAGATGSDKARDASKMKGRLTVAEKRVTGAVGPYVYWGYIVAANVLWLIPLALLIVLSQGAQIMSTIWLTYWEANSLHRQPAFYQGIYAMTGVLSASFNGLTGVALAFMSVNASRNLYRKALRHVFFSPMSFFDTTPLGRIQGIFSTDVSTMDNAVPVALRYTLTTAAGLVGAVIVISIPFPYYVGIAAAVAATYGVIVFYYRPFARESQRLDALNRGLLFSHFSESLAGLATIRTYGETGQFLAKNARLVDLQNRATVVNSAGKQWLYVRLEMTGSLLIFAIGLMCTAGGGHINPGQVALILNYMVVTTTQLSALSGVSTMLETSMNSVERILPYADGRLAQEAAYENPSDPRGQWIDKGAIGMDKIVMAYRPGQPTVLKNVSVAIQPGERIGIVGRTGAGKSSLTIALCRLAELTSGSISLDSVDTSGIGLRALRSNLAIIPQEPVLFSGTLRSNLDPFDEHSDAVLHDVLQRAHLAGRKTPSGKQRFTLDMVIDPSGANLSVGERSLVSLARALVRSSKILVLDEATASVDLETDAAIQLAIREDCRRTPRTLLCIAHRLRTILGWDKILVMDAGEVVAYAPPLELFDDEDSIFRLMCDDSGIVREDVVMAGRAG
ncbi:Multidrug resistance protein fer6 [Vanrija pseudolonga]|uniref:Multidrug resistance protein fer6 n=2 Tax=Vanrija pseudolonga TaxID=143232 RepID=A0AAF1BL30_9TREE|nr:Multidrug resistance protein fer6 [Vanrija pseudolonga]